MFGSSSSAAASRSSSENRPGDLDAEVLESLANVRIEVHELEGGDGAVLVLAHEGHVHDPDRPRLDQVGKRGGDLASELVAWEGDDQILDGSDLGHLSLLALRLRSTRRVSHRCLWRITP